jgi:hypothetical protein
MKVLLKYFVTDEARKVFGWYLDRDKWDGKRKATRDEIAGVLMDGSDETWINVISDYENSHPEQFTEDSAALVAIPFAKAEEESKARYGDLRRKS